MKSDERKVCPGVSGLAETKRQTPSSQELSHGEVTVDRLAVRGRQSWCETRPPASPLALDRLLCALTSASLTVNGATAPSSLAFMRTAPRQRAWHGQPCRAPWRRLQRWLSRGTEGCPCRASLEGEQCVGGGGAVKGHMPEREGPGTASRVLAPPSPPILSFLPSFLPHSLSTTRGQIMHKAFGIK